MTVEDLQMQLADAERQVADLRANTAALGQELYLLQVDAASVARPREFLAVIRERLDADYCCLGLSNGEDSPSTVAPGGIIDRNGRTNRKEWVSTMEMHQRFYAYSKPGEVVIPPDEFAVAIGSMFPEEEPTAFLAPLASVVFFCLSLDGRFYGVIVVAFVKRRKLSTSEVEFLRLGGIAMQSNIERTVRHAELEQARLQLLRQVKETEELNRQVSAERDQVSYYSAFLKRIIDNMPVALYVKDPSDDDRYTICNEGFSRFVGRPIDEIVGRTDLELFSPAVARKFRADDQLALGSDALRTVTERVNNPNGDSHVFVTSKGRFSGVDGKPMLFGMSEDRTEAVDSREELEIVNACLATMFLGGEDEAKSLNQVISAVVRYFGAEIGCLLNFEGDKVQVIAPFATDPDFAKGMLDDLYAAPAETIVESMEGLLRRPVVLVDVTEGNLFETEYWNVASEAHGVQKVGAARITVQGRNWGCFFIASRKKTRKFTERDNRVFETIRHAFEMILSRKRLLNDLKSERDRVVAAEKAKSLFFSSVSHDIRTPLNAIIGFSELLRMGDVPPEEMKTDLAIIDSSGKTLLQLVNDLLDLSKIDAGKMEIVPEPTDIRKLVDEMILVFGPQIGQRHQELVSEVPELPRLNIDPHRIRQILFNLIGNAVKYAGSCKIRIQAGYGPHGGRGATALPDAGLVGAAPRADRGTFTLSVIDGGAGLEPEVAARLMQPFSQAHISDRKNGTGLGLSICKRLAECMGGTFTLETAPGKGCAFTLAVPAEAVGGERRGTGVGERGTGNGERGTGVGERADGVPAQLPNRVLVADDSAVNRAVLKAMMKKLGITDLTMAEDGKAALEKLATEGPFDCLLTDMWMPEMDGAQLVAKIRADARYDGLKVCTITADVESQKTYKAQGFDDLLLKPVTLEKLKELFTRLGARPNG